jgi:hypothetical protein
MSVRKLELVDSLHAGVDPFAFWQAKQEEVDLQGWRSQHPFLSSLIEELCPRTIVEVGVWKGTSVLTMAEKIQECSLDCAIIAVDTWRGSSEHWCQPENYRLMKVQNGLPRLYEAFMANVIAKSLQGYVVPLPVDSLTAYEILKQKVIHPELVHIDAGHGYQSVSRDLEMWSDLLSPGGSIIMDDYDWDDENQTSNSWHDVARAVNDFVNVNSSLLEFRHSNGKCVLSF